MSRFCFCNCPAGFSAEPERHAPDCPGRSGAGKARTPVPATLTASQPVESGVDFGIDGRSVRVSQEAYSIFLAREAAGREKIAALQQRLTAADELADTMEGLLRLARGAIGENQWTLLTKDIDTMLSQDAQRTNNSRNAHCPHDGICHTSEETCADAQERIASLTAPAGAGQ